MLETITHHYLRLALARKAPIKATRAVPAPPLVIEQAYPARRALLGASQRVRPGIAQAAVPAPEPRSVGACETALARGRALR